MVPARLYSCNQICTVYLTPIIFDADKSRNENPAGMVLQPVHVMQIADVAWHRVNMGCADVVALQHKAVHAAVLEVIY